MSRKGLKGRQRGSILVQLGASAGVLVLPPLMMSVGVTLFGTQTEDRLQIAADQTVASAVSKSSALISLSPRRREIHEIQKSADRPPLHDEPTVNAPPPSAAEPAVEADESSKNAETDNAAEPAEPVPFLGPVPVTLIVVRKEPEPEAAEPETAEHEEEPAPASPPPTVESIAPVVANAAPKPPPAHVAHPRIKPDREEAHAPHHIAEKRPHAPVVAAARAAGATPHAPAPHHVAASAAPKAKPKSALQHRADLEN
jgi:hypothetical protein